MSELSETVGYVVLEQSPNTGIWYPMTGNPLHRSKSFAVQQMEDQRTMGAKFPLAVAEVKLVVITTYKDDT